MTKQIAFIAAALFIISACARRNYPKVDDVEKITVIIDSSKGLNFGTVIPINFTAHTERKGSVNVNQFISFQNPNIYFYKNGLHINVDPTGYSVSFIQVKYKYLDALYWDSFKMELTYDEDICINASGESAKNEDDEKTLVGKLLRSAVRGAGTDGKIGLDGKAAHNLKVYVWKDSVTSVYSIYVKDEKAKTVKYYVSNQVINLFIDATGGNGSNGKNGTKGGTGTSGGNTARGGNGSSGGDGGDGGSGGNGGDVSVYIHPSAKEFKDKIQIVNNGGTGGEGGDGGRGGYGGTGRPAGSDGYDGYDGKKGFKGFDGYLKEIRIEEFVVDEIL